MAQELTPEQLRLRRSQEEQRIKPPEPTPEQVQQQQLQGMTPRQAAEQAKEAELKSGLITEAGETSDYLLQAGYVHDLANKGAAFLNNAAQALPDNPITQSIKDITQMMDDDIGSFEEVTDRSTRAVQEGMESDDLLRRASANLAAAGEVTASALPDLTVQLPLSIAARVANEDAPWLNPPAIVKDDPAGTTAYEIIQVVAPSVVFGSVTGNPSAGMSVKGLAAGTARAYAVEAALETIPQRSATDLVLGKETAIKMGELANVLGYDGSQLTNDLIEGRKPHAQGLVAVVGYLQNLGFNVGTDQVLKGLAKKFGREWVSPETPKVAEVLGESPQTAAKKLDNVAEPVGRPDLEPQEMVDVDSAVSVVKPAGGDKYVSKEALTKELLRKNNLGDDYLTSADRNYFSNIKALSDEKGLQTVIKESMKTVRRLKAFPEDLASSMARAEAWWSSNKHLLDHDLDKLARNFLSGEGEELLPDGTRVQSFVADNVQPMGIAKYIDIDDTQKGVESALKEYSVVGEEGFISAAIVGEELGVRIQRMARQATNLDNANIDFTADIENLIELHEKMSLFLIPLRRGKRRWAVEGIDQQRKTIRKVKDADVQGAIRAKDPVSSNAASRSFETISMDATDPGMTIREMWNAYKSGNKAAGDTLKTYLGLLSYGDPVATATQVDNLSGILLKQLRGQTPDARKSLYYSYLITRIRPQQASLSSNVFNLLRGPIGELIQGNKARAIGQFLGGLQVQQAALQNGFRAFRQGSSAVDMLDGASKFDFDATSLKAKNAQIDAMWEGALKEMNKNGASQFQKFVARTNYLQQRLANAPGMKIAGRLLTAQDDWAKSTYAAQIATGRAWERHAEIGGDLAEIVREEMDNVFRNGEQNGKIIDEDVLTESRYLTFQGEIPTGEMANPVDNTFKALQEAADDSAFWTWTSPFTRLSYGVLEATGRVMAGSLNAATSPISIVTRSMGEGGIEPGTWMLTRMKRYDSIIRGEQGVLAQQRLKSDLAFAEGWTVSVAGYAAFGGITGNNPPEGMPRQSFIIPWNNKKGFIAISYEKMDPIAGPTSIIADLVQGFKNGDITQRFYEKGMWDMLYSVGVGTVDKGFNTGIQESARMFDIKNLSENSLARSGASIGATALSQVTGAYGGIARMVGDWSNPYVTITRNEKNQMDTFWNTLRQRTFGGVGNPVLYDPLTGEKELKSAPILGADNWFTLTLGSALTETFIPGRTASKERNPALEAMTLVGMDWNPRKLISSVNGQKLSPEQQSVFSRELHTVGELGKKLERAVTTTPIKGDIKALKQALANGDSNKVEFFSNVIQGRLQTVINNTKEETFNQGTMASELRSERLKVEQPVRRTLQEQVDELIAIPK